MPTKPFEQPPFRQVPERPRLPHGNFEMRAETIVVETPLLGPVRAHVRVHESGPPLLLVHGFMTSSCSCRYALKRLGGLSAFLRMLDETVDVRAMGRWVRSLEERRTRGERFPIPLPLVHARRDPMVPPAVGERLAELVPDAELVWLDDASHFAHVDATDRFLARALPFLEVGP